MALTIHDLRTWKSEGRRWAMLTAYDFPTAQILDRAGVPVLLVGDSLANNVLGYADTLPVTMEEMLHHTRAVTRGVEHAMVVGDMPFLSYQVSREEGIRNAGRFLKEGGAHAVKIEGARVELVHDLVELGIPVMAHVGLTPQSVHAMGGFRVQGRGPDAARVLDQAQAMEKAGAFSIVLEGLPS
ncbi:MAG: 3-methyl-2-oxobutanoate hydroxymethyltransferase, partial [Actinomycetota bacterium]